MLCTVYLYRSNPANLINVLLVNQNISVSRLAILHINNSLVRILHRPLLNPRLDILLNCKLQHLLDVLGRTNQASAQLELAHNEVECIDGGEFTRVRSSDLHEIGAVTEELTLRPGVDPVVVSGEPVELAMLLFGRDQHRDLAFAGPPESVGRLRGSDLGF